MAATRIQSAYPTISLSLRDGHVAAVPVVPIRPCMARAGEAKLDFWVL